jgi:SSS family solute:Na+ symporter
VFIGIISTLIGMAGRSFIPEEGMTPDAVFYTVLQEVLPPFLGGILAMGLMAAVVSGGDSFIMQGASNLTRDVYNRYINPEASSEQLLRISRWSGTGIAALGLLVSFAVTDIITLYSYALKWSGVALVIPFLAIMFWRRTTRTGVIWSMVLALAATIIWEIAGVPLGIHEALVGYVVMAVALVSVSLATSHSDGEQAVALWSENLQ